MRGMSEGDFWNEARRRIAGMRVLDTEVVDAFRDGFNEGFRAGIEAAAEAVKAERARSIAANDGLRIEAAIRALRPDAEGGP